MGAAADPARLRSPQVRRCPPIGSRTRRYGTKPGTAVTTVTRGSGFVGRCRHGLAWRLGRGVGPGEVTGVVERDEGPLAAAVRSAPVPPARDAGVERGEGDPVT